MSDRVLSRTEENEERTVTLKEPMQDLTDKGKIALESLGQAGIRIDIPGYETIYIDPYLSNAVQEHEDSNLDRLIPPPFEPNAITDARYVLITHEHLDHCDPDTLLPLSVSSPDAVFIGPPYVVEILFQNGIDRKRVISANSSDSNSINLFEGEVKLYIAPASHPIIETDDNGNYRYIGYILQYKETIIYHSGDTIVSEEVINALKAFKRIDLAILPVNERNYYREKRGIIGNMSVRDAFWFAEEIGARKVMPMHWDMFAINQVFKEEIEIVYKNLNPDFDMVFGSLELEITNQ